jgi:ABC-type dipeptide/oligopeptide/nickel transport system ATPase component
LGKKGAAEVSQYVADWKQNAALYVTVIEKVMHLWKGCIDVDDYVSFMAEFQYTIEVAHSHIRHVTFLMCGLLEILNKSKEHGPGYVVDKSDVIRLFDAINESIRRVQCVGVENGIQASPSITDYYQKTFPDMYTIEYMLRHHTKSNKRKVGGMETYVFQSPTTKCRFDTQDILQLITHGAYLVDPTNGATTEQLMDFFSIMKYVDLPDILQVKDKYTFEVSGKRFTTKDVKDLVKQPL